MLQATSDADFWQRLRGQIDNRFMSRVRYATEHCKTPGESEAGFKACRDTRSVDTRWV
jgi:hypothetical protein